MHQLLPWLKWLYETKRSGIYRHHRWLTRVCFGGSQRCNGTQIIKINTGSIFESNNQNPAYAKAGDTLRVAFAVDDVFTSDAATFTIPNQDPSVSAAGQTYDAMLTVSSDPIEGFAV